MNRPDRWWRQAVGYEIYVRSFQDSDGDGVGDLPGVRQRLDHLEDLGVDLLWLTPFYPSPQADHGYDVADYRSVDPTFGTVEDLEALLSDAHDRGMRVIADLVPNHTSDQHPWFRSALQGRAAEYRDYYVWRDPAPDGGPPNNWVSHFGGPAWSYHEPTGQYYMHLFLPEQPDLNWANPAVRDEFDDILRLWFDRGVDGVRIDVAHSLMEDPDYRDNPVREDGRPASDDPREAFAAFDHDHDLDQPEVLEIYRRWRAIAEEHDALLLGEVYLLDAERVGRYVAGRGLHLAFCFLALRVTWNADAIREVLGRAVAAGGDRLAWPLSSHDDPHAATRFGGGRTGARRALAYLTLLCGLPGVPFLYQGDELGLDDALLPRQVAEDPIAVRNPGMDGRDPCRAPMPWSPEPGFGFTSGTPWLPFGEQRTEADTAAAQRARDDSHLARVRALLAVRRDLEPWRLTDPVRWLDPRDGVVGFRRGHLMAVCNTGDEPTHVSVDDRLRVVFASDGAVDIEAGGLKLAADTGALLSTRGASTGPGSGGPA